MMLTDWLDEQRGVRALEQVGAAIEAAVDRVLEDPKNRTRDLGGSMNTDEFGERVADAVTAAAPGDRAAANAGAASPATSRA